MTSHWRRSRDTEKPWLSFGLLRTSAVMYYYLRLSYSENGDATLAIEAYQEAVEVNPTYAAAYVRFEIQYRKSGELSQAREYYKKACKLSQDVCRQFSAQFLTG